LGVDEHNDEMTLSAWSDKQLGADEDRFIVMRMRGGVDWRQVRDELLWVAAVEPRPSLVVSFVSEYA